MTPNNEALAAEIKSLADEYAEASADDARHYAPGRKAAARVNLYVEIDRLASSGQADSWPQSEPDMTLIADPRMRAAAEAYHRAAGGHWFKLRAAIDAAIDAGQAGSAVPLEWKKAVQEAYGWLWHVNNEPMAPVPMWSPEQAAYEARKNLRDLLTKDERGEAINAVGGLLENKSTASPTQPASAQAREGATLRQRLQQRCSDWGAYWRAPDAHGVNLSHEQALDLLRDALGVEVEIATPAAPAQPLTDEQHDDLDIARCGVPTLESELRFAHECELGTVDYPGSLLCRRREYALSTPPAPPAPPAPRAPSIEPAEQSITINLSQARALVEFFGGEDTEAKVARVERERQRCYDIVLRAPYEQEELDASCWPRPEVVVEVAIKSMAFDITSKIRNGAVIGEKKE